MSHTQKATGRKDTTAGEQLATMRDVDELFTIRLAEYHEAHVFEIRQWANWKSLPLWKRARFSTWWALKEEWARAKQAWNWWRDLWAKRGPEGG